METISNDIIRYVHFDFHAVCGHIHFERLSLLYDQIEDFLKKNRCVLAMLHLTLSMKTFYV
ncbi:Phosphoinositide phosphatase SAC7 [Dendrobium catenatum]|uniref:Phosphoinositide phosphatase SAC7 n=1 Tax=Dendrobium catenatum TaxID=906689 RepID=A0A2I0VE24_9ASPA|nr:Phosphoinositide phosphatase SAC7 [Dendrobium catenatum]